MVSLPAACGAAPPSPPAGPATPNPTQLDLGQIRADIEREYAGQLIEIGNGAGTVVVGLKSTAAGAAADLVARYGTKVRVSVGLLPYPAPSNGANVCNGQLRARSNTGPLRATIEMASHTVGHDGSFAAIVHLTNTGPIALDVETGQPLLVFLFEPGGTIPVGAAAGGIAGTGLAFRLEPGGSSSIPATGGTSSCDPRLGYELPDGPYVARAEVEIDQVSSSADVSQGWFLSDPLPVTVATK
jgi:hypothetical protein